MRLSLFSILFAALSFITADAQRGDNFIKLSDNITTETRDVSGFDKLDVSEDFEVFIRVSDTAEKVEIESNENLHDLIQVENKNGTLKIYTKSYSTQSGGRNGGAHERLVAYITVTNLTEIKGQEDVIFELEDKLYTDQLSIQLDEDCTFEGYLEVQKLVVDLVEDSVIDIEGKATTMVVEADEDCVIKGFGFEAGKLEIVLNEDSEAKLTVNGDIDLEAKEDSYFHYRGDVNFIRKRLRGDSEVHAH